MLQKFLSAIRPKNAALAKVATIQEANLADRAAEQTIANMRETIKTECAAAAAVHCQYPTEENLDKYLGLEAVRESKVRGLDRLQSDFSMHIAGRIVARNRAAVTDALTEIASQLNAEKSRHEANHASAVTKLGLDGEVSGTPISGAIDARIAQCTRFISMFTNPASVSYDSITEIQTAISFILQ